MLKIKKKKQVMDIAEENFTNQVFQEVLQFQKM